MPASVGTPTPDRRPKSAPGRERHFYRVGRRRARRVVEQRLATQGVRDMDVGAGIEQSSQNITMAAFAAAAHAAVAPSARFESTTAPTDRSRATASNDPLSAAAMRGVRPSPAPVWSPRWRDVSASFQASRTSMVATWPRAAAVASGPSGGPGQRPTGSVSAPPREEEGARGRAVVERREEERRAAVLVGVVQVDVRGCFQQVFHLFGVSGFTCVPKFVFIITADREEACSRNTRRMGAERMSKRRTLCALGLAA